MKKMIIASTSTVYGGAYLEYILPELEILFEGVSEIVFVPYARPSGMTHDEYTEVASKGFAKIGKKVKGIHQFENAIEAVKSAKGIFVGGGNTFLLVKQLYDNKLLEEIKTVVENGIPYFGTSAGSNITGLTMQNTNDMPIAFPPSYDTLGLIPFNINPHYLDPIEGLKHMGETRETRIKEYHKINTTPVLGIREGGWLEVKGKKITLKGDFSARWFESGKEPVEIASGTVL
ncbi:MAG: dipeptidase PepE [Flavobacteriaceae bacterium]|nr:dipeptidase PepE [Flavobacteriaceae bacterium]